MKKFISLLLLALFFISTFSGCVKPIGNDNTTTENSTQDAIEADSSTIEASTTDKSTVTEKPTEKQTSVEKESDKEVDNETTTKKNQSNPLISDEDLEKIENSQAEVFFSDNPNNSYIVAVVDKYNVDEKNLVALIKVNAEFPSGIVFEFSGKTDENGELVMTYEELKYVYNIDENGVVTRASKTISGNDGMTFIESKMVMTIAKEYFIPELPNLKANKRYPE